MTVGELRNRMTTMEYTRWIALYAVEAKEREIAEKRASRKRGR